MEAIELTEEHKSKLLEMCKDLFPDYKIEMSAFKTKHLDFYNHGTKLYPKWPIYSHSIHWFEFCMTHLARKIGNSGRLFDNPVEDAGDMLADMVFKQEWFNNYHPVDYLYEQFKQLK